MICSHCYQVQGYQVQENVAGQCLACGEDPLLVGRYVLQKQVGQGASARTYKAVRVSDGQSVAVKELLFHRIDVLKTHELFEREARVLRQLSHPGIPTYIESFQVEEGRSLCFYLVQEFIEGQTLADEMAGRRFDERAVLEFLIALGDPVEYLHGLPVPVIHRDIKPSNLMRRSMDGRLMLIDFGTVRDVLKPQGQGNTVAGTFGYMAPEQLMGDATPASDVYAMGATAVALLAGQELSGGEACLQWLKQMNLSGATRQLLAAMLASNPSHRPSIAAVRRQAHAILSGVVPAGSSEPRAAVKLRTNFVLAGFFSCLALMVAAMLLIIVPSSDNMDSLSHGPQDVVTLESPVVMEIEPEVELEIEPEPEPVQIVEPEVVEVVTSEPKTERVEKKSLGRFTLGMSVAEANEAADGEMKEDGQYSIWLTHYQRREDRPPLVGKRYLTSEVFSSYPATCELIFLVDNRLSEVQCGLRGPRRDGNQADYDDFERKVLFGRMSDHGSRIKNERIGPSHQRVWQHEASQLGMLLGGGRYGEMIRTGDSTTNMILWLESSEHARVVNAAREQFYAEREARQRL